MPTTTEPRGLWGAWVGKECSAGWALSLAVPTFPPISFFNLKFSEKLVPNSTCSLITSQSRGFSTFHICSQ